MSNIMPRMRGPGKSMASAPAVSQSHGASLRRPRRAERPSRLHKVPQIVPPTSLTTAGCDDVGSGAMVNAANWSSGPLSVAFAPA